MILMINRKILQSYKHEECESGPTGVWKFWVKSQKEPLFKNLLQPEAVTELFLFIFTHQMALWSHTRCLFLLFPPRFTTGEI